MSGSRRRRPIPPKVVGAAIFAAALAVVTWTIALQQWPRTPLATIPAAPAPLDDGALALPKALGSLRFAVMGDVGRGSPAQYDTAGEMARWHERFEFTFVLMLGDNIYADAGTAEEYALRFERPYKALLDRGVTFYAALGNHDPPGQVHYAPFNMNGNRYYRFAGDAGPPLDGRRVEFFALDTVTLDERQVSWLIRMLAASTADWKVAFHHHPLYTSGRYWFAASRLRSELEPIFVRFGVDVVFSGHEHFYERLIPQHGVQYFTSGAGGALRPGDASPSSLTAASFDEDTHFLLVEIAGDTMYFQAISRTGRTVDHGRIERPEEPVHPPVLRR